MKSQRLRLAARPLPWLALLLLAMLVSARQVVAQFAAPPGVAQLVVAGSYTGTVAISEPAPLGDLDLLLEITNANGQLTGKVNPIKTQVFLGGPTFTGSVTTNGVITPTVRIESQTFESEVSGRTVQRRFVLTGEVLTGGDLLRGTYTETILGFKPHPMLVTGTFLLARPSGVTGIITVPAPQGSTPTPTPGTPGGPPTATATPTVPSNNGNGAKIYLPIVQRAVVNTAADAAQTVDETLASTPTPSPTPTPAMVAPSSVLTTTNAQQQILLPLIMR